MTDAKPTRGRPEPRGLPIPIPDSADCPSGLARSIDELVLGEELSAKEQRRLTDAIAAEPAVRAYYDRAVLAERLLSGGPDSLFEPSPAELARVETQVFERAGLSPDASSQRAHRSIFGWVAGLVAVGAAVLIALPFLLSRQPDSPGRPFEARGSTAPPAGGEFQMRGTPAKHGKLVGLRVFCVDRRASPAVHELTASTATGAAPTCSLGATLKFAYTNRSKLTHLFVVGVDEAGRGLWYAPIPPAQMSIRVSGAVDKPLPRAVRLAVNHQPGLLRIYALFSAKAISRVQVSAAIAKLRVKRGESPVTAQKLLPIDDTEQRSLLIKLGK